MKKITMETRIKNEEGKYTSLACFIEHAIGGYAKISKEEIEIKKTDKGVKTGKVLEESKVRLKPLSRINIGIIRNTLDLKFKINSYTQSAYKIASFIEKEYEALYKRRYGEFNAPKPKGFTAKKVLVQEKFEQKKLIVVAVAAAAADQKAITRKHRSSKQLLTALENINKELYTEVLKTLA